MSTRVINIYPLAPLQRGLFFHAQTQPEARVYHQQLCLDFEGPLSIAQLSGAFAGLIARHDVLRTGFEWEDLDEPLQVVFSDCELPLRELDLRDTARPAQRLVEIEREERDAPFDLQRPPLMRVCVVRLADEAYRCIWTHHHIILDGWSVSLLLAEWRALYLGETTLSASFPYASFIAWLGEQDQNAAKRYFGPLLAEAGEPTPLPSFAGVGPKSNASGHAELELRYSADQTRVLQAAASRARVTASTLAIAALARVLARHAGRDGALLGLTLAGRSAELVGCENAVGLFINTLPLWIPHTPGNSNDAALADVANRVQGVLQHAHASLSGISALTPHAGSRPLFEAIVVVENYPVDKELAEPLGPVSVRIAEPVHSADVAQTLNGRNEFPLSLIVVTEGDALSMTLSYDRARLTDEELQALRAQLEAELQSLCGQADSAARAQRRGRLRELGCGARGNATDAPLHLQFERGAEHSPEALALIDGAQALTYRELSQRAHSVALALHARGIGRDCRVALLLPRSADWVVAMLGVLKCGAAFVPLDVSTPGARVRELLADSAASALIGSETSLARLGRVELPSLVVEEIVNERRSERRLAVASEPSDAAYLIYTSGSTGKPKAVVVEHRAIVSYTHSVLDALSLRGPLRFGWLSTVAADLGYTQLFGALLGGGTLCVVSQEAAFDPGQLGRSLREGQVDVLKLTPSHLRGLFAADPSAQLLPRHGLIFGGEALDAELVQRVRQLAPTLAIWNHYGPTETAVGAVYWPVLSVVDDLAPATRLPLGRPLPNRQLYVLDAVGELCAEGEVGELHIAGEALAREYLGRPELTAERFVRDPFAADSGERMYRTGDRVRWLLDGNLAFLGRVDRQVKIRGYRVELGELEAEIVRVCPHVSEVVVRAIEQAAGGLALHVFLVAATAISVEKLRDDLAMRLPDAMLPSSIVTLDAMPLTPNGKIDFTRLVPAERVERRAPLTAPATAAQSTLVAIWQSVLRVEPIGVNDSFFELGGDSILSLQIVARARQQGLEFTPQQLLAAKTIAKLCGAGVDAGTVALEQAALEPKVPLLPAQLARLTAQLRPSYRLLRAGEGLNEALLERALTLLAAGHTALRLELQGLSGAPLEAAQRVRASQLSSQRVVSVRFSVRDVSEIAEQAAQLLPDLYDASAPILAAALGRCDGAPVLLLAAHPLCVDDAAWPVLLSDLSYLVLELAEGRTPELRARGRELLRFAQACASFSADAQEQAFSYWLEHPDIPGDDVAAPEDASTRSELRLTAAQTQGLSRLCAALHSGIELPLIAALCAVSDEAALAIALPAGRAGASALACGDRSLALFAPEQLLGALSQPAPLYLRTQRGELDLPLVTAIANELAQAWPRLCEHVRLCHGPSDEFLRESLMALPRGRVAIRLLGSLDAPGAALAPRDVRLGEVLAFDAAEVSHALEISVHSARGELCITCEGPLAQRWTRELERALQRMAAWDASDVVPPAHAFPLCREFAYDVRSLPLPWARIEDVYPLSPMQHGMLLHTLLQPGSGIYLMQQHYEWNGALDYAALARAWAELLDAHPILRSAFEMPSELPPVQCVYRDVPVDVPCVDLRGMPAAQARAAITRELEAELSAGFELSRAPLTRLRVYRLTDDQHVLVRSFHHVLNDAWCFGLIMDELLARYRACAQGLPYLRPPARPYRDYIAWLAVQDRGAAEQFYKQQLSDVPEPTPLPQAPNAVRASEIASVVGDVEAALSIETTRRITALCQQLELTPNTFVQGAWAILLARHARTQDSVFGVTVAGRPADLDGVEDMVGLFIHSLPLRVHVDDDSELGPWLSTLLATNLSLRSYEHASLVEIAGFLGRPKGQPLFESLLVFENAPLPAADAAVGLGVQLDLGEDRVHTNFPLTVVVYPGDKLGLRISFDCAYYDVARAQALLDQLLWLMEQMALRPQARLGSFELVAPRERARLVAFNQTAQAFPLEQSYAELVARRVAANPERIVAR